MNFFKKWLSDPEIKVLREQSVGIPRMSVARGEEYPETSKLYKEINYCLKNESTELIYPISQFETEEFLAMYYGLKYDINVPFEHLHNQMNQTEYFVFDFSEYKGPRNSPLTPVLRFRVKPAEKVSINASEQNKRLISTEGNVISIQFGKRIG